MNTSALRLATGRPYTPKPNGGLWSSRHWSLGRGLTLTATIAAISGRTRWTLIIDTPAHVAYGWRDLAHSVVLDIEDSEIGRGEIRALLARAAEHRAHENKD